MKSSNKKDIIHVWTCIHIFVLGTIELYNYKYSRGTGTCTCTGVYPGLLVNTPEPGEVPENIDPLSIWRSCVPLLGWVCRCAQIVRTWIILSRTQNDCITGSIQLKQLAAELRWTNCREELLPLYIDIWRWRKHQFQRNENVGIPIRRLDW